MRPFFFLFVSVVISFLVAGPAIIACRKPKSLQVAGFLIGQGSSDKVFHCRLEPGQEQESIGSLELEEPRDLLFVKTLRNQAKTLCHVRTEAKQKEGPSPPIGEEVDAHH